MMRLEERDRCGTDHHKQSLNFRLYKGEGGQSHFANGKD
jgi:hypothetical protein